jgi:preprotein translocase subunit SecA
LEDDLLRIFGSERISGIMDRLGMEEGQPIEHGLISKAIENAQKKVESHNFDIRKHLLEYDDVMNTHREIIYSLRRDILSENGSGEIIRTMLDEQIEALVGRFVDPKADPDDWDIRSLKESMSRLFGFQPMLGPDEMDEDAFYALKVEELTEQLKTQARTAYDQREMAFGKEDLRMLERFILLQIIDHQWISHLQDMEHLKEGIGLRGYGQLDPLREYKKEGYALFEELMNRIREESLITLSRIQIQRRRPADIPKRERKAMQLSHGGDGERPATIKREGKKIGRNAPCPCGSGKKYKKCCGANA